jgi:hypothetical protein
MELCKYWSKGQALIKLGDMKASEQWNKILGPLHYARRKIVNLVSNQLYILLCLNKTISKKQARHVNLTQDVFLKDLRYYYKTLFQTSIFVTVITNVFFFRLIAT